MSNDKVEASFYCGYAGARGPIDLSNLSKAEQKTVRNFQLFLKGKGERCVLCLHKRAKHDVRCGAKGCDCTLSNSDVHATRAQGKAPGTEVAR